MLNGKETEQNHVDQQGLGERLFSAGINRLGNNEVPDEAYSVEKRNEKNHITDRTIHKSKGPGRNEPPLYAVAR